MISKLSQGRKVLSSISSFRKEVIWVTISSVTINVLALATPLVMMQVFDRIIAKGSLETLAILMGGASLAILMESFLRILRSWLSAWSAAQFEQRAMTEVASRLLTLPIHQFEGQGTGSHQDHFKAAQSLKSYFSGQTYQQIIDLPFVALYIGVVALISPWLGSLLLGGFLVFALLAWWHGFSHRRRTLQRKETDLRRSNFVAEVLTNIHTLKSMTMEALMLRRYERLQEAGARAIASLAHALDMASGIGTIFSSLMTMLTVALGAYLVVHGDMTTGELAACTLLSFRALAPVQRLGTIWARHQQEGVMRNSLAQILGEPPLPAQTPSSANSSGNDGLHVDHVTFSFPGAPKPLLRDISFELNPGECVLIDGENGSGRSTLLQLLSGMITPTEGDIRWNGIPHEQVDPDTLKKTIAYLPQRTHLFEGTLLENITAFESDRIDTSLALAQTLRVDTFVAKMPRGWDTHVGDSSVESMPLGHRQRIAIVRSLSTSPDLILFDDASTAVDLDSEGWILEYLKGLKGKKTMVIVSQRPSIQRLADRVLTLREGRLLAQTELDAGTASPVIAQAAQETVKPEPSTTASDVPDAWARVHATVMTNFTEPGDLAGCIPVLLRALGWRRSARELAEALPYFEKSLTLAGFENAMVYLGYSSADVVCRLSDLDARSLPCLFIPTKAPAFVVLAVTANGLQIAYDGISEPQEIPASRLKGHAYFFRRSEEAPPSNRGWVASALYRFRPLVVQAGLASIISGLVLSISSLFLMAVYNEVIPTAALDTLTYLAAGVLMALGLGGIFIALRSSILAYLAGRIDYLFGSTMLQKILSLSPGLTERASVGAQVARLGTFEAIRDAFTGPLASTLLELPAVLVILIVLAIVNPIAMLVFLVTVLIYAGLYLWLEPVTARRVSVASRTSTKRNEFIIEMISKMRTLRECGASRRWLDRFREVSAEATMANYQTELMSSLLAGLSYGIMMLAGLAIVTFTVPQTLNQTVGPGVLIASMTLMWRVLAPMQTVFNNLSRIERIRNAIQQIESVMRIKGERLESGASPVARGLSGRIDFSRVSFRYNPNSDPALVGATFTVQPGEVIAVTGPNGGGKSTLFKMLLGMYQPQAGAVLVDGVDIRQLDPLEMRRLVGYAPQESQFYRATLSQNLRLARPDATQSELLQALDQAGALEQIMALPKGLEFRVGDNSSEQLPASLRQKLTLARAYLCKAPILLLDEPSSGLDAQGDAKFTEMLRQLRGVTTTLFITHRPSHMRLADRILIFDGGYLRASGTPDEILQPARTP